MFIIFPVILLPTAIFWIPFATILVPLLLCFLLILYIFLKLTGLNVILRKRIHAMYTWSAYRSDKTRKYYWKKVYNCLTRMFPTTNWTVTNWGYAVNTESGIVINVEGDSVKEKYGLQLYYMVATGLRTIKCLENKHIMDIGSGRGGGL